MATTKPVFVVVHQAGSKPSACVVDIVDTEYT